MKVMIACGGTGGHLFPGLAVAELLVARRHEVQLLVSEKAVDQTAVKNSAITVRSVSAVGYTGAGVWAVWSAGTAAALVAVSSPGPVDATSGALAREQPSNTKMPPITNTCSATTINTTFDTFIFPFATFLLVWVG